ncbi:MAG: hypothetical protein LBN01_01885 [Endomicrobium sp.]|jgi:hypothetical protein|nr:hypothetical protein [Endomicrobium sp.]
MRKHFKYIIVGILFVFCICASLLYAQERVSASLNKNKVFIGDIIRFAVKVRLPHGAQISADQDFSFDDFDIISSDIRHTSAAENIYELNFNIAAYKTGTFTVNQLTVFYISSDGTDNLFFTPEAQVEVLSVIGNETAKDIKDIKALKKLRVSPVYVLLMVIMSVLFIVCVVSVVKTAAERIRKPKQFETDPKIKALSALNNLYKDIDSVSARIFYYKMSEILRTYVSKQYNFNAMEMTTSEFFDKIKTFIPREININEFKNYLKMFNLARYADFTPDKIETENNYNFTKKLLELL